MKKGTKSVKPAVAGTEQKTNSASNTSNTLNIKFASVQPRNEIERQSLEKRMAVHINRVKASFEAAVPKS